MSGFPQYQLGLLITAASLVISATSYKQGAVKMHAFVDLKLESETTVHGDEVKMPAFVDPKLESETEVQGDEVKMQAFLDPKFERVVVQGHEVEEKIQAFVHPKLESEAQAVANASASRVMTMAKEVRSQNTKEMNKEIIDLEGHFKSRDFGLMRKLGEEKMQVFVDPKLASEALAAGQPQLCVFCYCCDPPPCGHKRCCTDMICGDLSKPKGACTFSPKRCTCDGCNT